MPKAGPKNISASAICHQHLSGLTCFAASIKCLSAFVILFIFGSGLDIKKYPAFGNTLTLAVIQIDIKLLMKFVPFFTLTLICVSSFGQFNLSKLDSSSLPRNIKYVSHIINAVKWTDSLGLNYVVTTETGRVYSKAKDEEDLFDAFLYAYHYIVKKDSTKLLWKLYDYNKGCDLDLDFYFIDRTFAVTDLDKNGIAEVWIMYKNSCHGDVSPVPTKIIMYEGSKKYALRGETKVQVSAKDFVGGSYSLDENFKNGRLVFRQYAVTLWNKNKKEKWHR